MTDQPDLDAVLEFLATELHECDEVDFGDMIWLNVDMPGNVKSKRLGWLLTGNGMLETIGKMRERGWIISMDGKLDGYWAAVAWHEAHGPHYFVEKTLPEAVARAAYAALKAEPK